jgi:hypothetical protein
MNLKYLYACLKARGGGNLDAAVKELIDMGI